MIILVFSLMLMFVTGSEMDCIPTIKVPRNTVFVVPVMSKLKINCTVARHGCHRNPRMSWCKIYKTDCKALNYTNNMKAEWKNITANLGMAFLIFQNISMEDAGFYRCKEGDTSIGHAINVTVTDNVEDKVSHNRSNPTDNKNNEFSPTPSNTMFTAVDDLNTPSKIGLQWIWHFVYIWSAIAGLVFIVITVTLLYAIRCQGRKCTRTHMANKNQYMDTQKKDPLLPPHLCLDSDLLTHVVYRV